MSEDMPRLRLTRGASKALTLIAARDLHEDGIVANIRSKTSSADVYTSPRN
jgi:hypothetical protein